MYKSKFNIIILIGTGSKISFLQKVLYTILISFCKFIISGEIFIVLFAK